MTHEMRLDPTPFAAIARGDKTLELRLYDEKRKAIARGDLILFIKERAGICVVLHAKAADICHNGLMEALLQFGQFLGNNFFYAGILQADSIDHTGGTFRNSGSRIAKTGIFGSALERECT